MNAPSRVRFETARFSFEGTTSSSVSHSQYLCRFAGAICRDRTPKPRTSHFLSTLKTA